MYICMIYLCNDIGYFFFNVTATTNIYTYCHTLSLHDALPISGAWCWGWLARTVCRSGMRSPPVFLTFVSRRSCRPTVDDTLMRLASSKRSEEHTSELQSLMRISYAVFCLKKQNNITTLHQHHTNLTNVI